MDKIKVVLLHDTPLNVGLKALSKPYQKEDQLVEQFVKVAKVLKHESIMEHYVFSFDINGISRLCLQELARHRIASLTVQSSRFTLQTMIKDKAFTLEKYFVIPENADQYFLDSLSRQVDVLRRMGHLKNDQLKYLLPESFRTDLVLTINARSLTNFLHLRLSKNAHFEIRHLAQLILKAISFHPLFEDVKFS